jgi:hypothetical protein
MEEVIMKVLDNRVYFYALESSTLEKIILSHVELSRGYEC